MRHPRGIWIYYEGAASLRPGFYAFFGSLRDEARRRRIDFRLVASRSGPEACGDFGRALKAHADAWNFLLIDSDGTYDSMTLCEQYKWGQAHASSVFWMVEMMEAWFHADKEKLEEFYGKDGFNRKALKSNPNVEEISKADLESGLRRATEKTKKGNYFDNKTSHGPKLLEKIRPEFVQNSAPNCKRLFDAVLAKLDIN